MAQKDCEGKRPARCRDSLVPALRRIWRGQQRYCSIFLGPAAFAIRSSLKWYIGACSHAAQGMCQYLMGLKHVHCLLSYSARLSWHVLCTFFHRNQTIPGSRCGCLPLKLASTPALLRSTRGRAGTIVKLV